MLVTESGIIIDFRFVHPLNAQLPILVTESGIVIDLRFVHPLNAAKPMLVTKSESFTSVRFWHSENVECSITDTPSGIIIENNDDWENAPYLMLSTESGSAMLEITVWASELIPI